MHILKEIHCILPRISELLNVYFTVYCTFYQRYPLNSGWSLSQQSQGEKLDTLWANTERQISITWTTTASHYHQLTQHACMCLGCGRQFEYLKGTHAGRGKICTLKSLRRPVDLNASCCEAAFPITTPLCAKDNVKVLLFSLLKKFV